VATIEIHVHTHGSTDDLAGLETARSGLTKPADAIWTGLELTELQRSSSFFLVRELENEHAGEVALHVDAVLEKVVHALGGEHRKDVLRTTQTAEALKGRKAFL
jgi:hypothetical protein